ncbi:MAG: hypothetical protein IPI44_23400 [Sulfuritalea sp.]|nr:hypothetical protein [Sulfuritalea sp.]
MPVVKSTISRAFHRARGRGPTHRKSRKRFQGDDQHAGGRGLRAWEASTGNLLTGQLYIALDVFPDAPKAKIDWSTTPPEFPTVVGSLQDLQNSLTSIAKETRQDGLRGHRRQPAADAEDRDENDDGARYQCHRIYAGNPAAVIVEGAVPRIPPGSCAGG